MFICENLDALPVDCALVSTFLLNCPSALICSGRPSSEQTTMLSSESNDRPLGLLEVHRYSDNFFSSMVVTITLRSLMYATFLPQNDEQMKGLSPDLTYGNLDLIEKSLQRNEADESSAVKNPSMVFANPCMIPST